MHIRDADGVSYFNPSQAGAGLGTQFQPCTTYSAAMPDVSCPFRPEVSWEALCPAAGETCFRPLVKLEMNLSDDTGFGKMSDLGLRFMGQTFFVQGNRCSILAENQKIFDNPSLWNLNDVTKTNLSPDGLIVQSLFSTSFSGSRRAEFLSPIPSCDEFLIRFSLLGASSNPAGENQARVCLANAYNQTCLFAWSFAGGNWTLESSGVRVFPSLASPEIPFVAGDELAFYFFKGLVTFKVNGRTVWIFEQVREGDIQIQLMPGPRDYMEGLLLRK